MSRNQSCSPTIIFNGRFDLFEDLSAELQFARLAELRQVAAVEHEVRLRVERVDVGDGAFEMAHEAFVERLFVEVRIRDVGEGERLRGDAPVCGVARRRRPRRPVGTSAGRTAARRRPGRHRAAIFKNLRRPSRCARLPSTPRTTRRARAGIPLVVFPFQRNHIFLPSEETEWGVRNQCGARNLFPIPHRSRLPTAEFCYCVERAFAA